MLLAGDTVITASEAFSRVAAGMLNWAICASLHAAGD
jgi:hypothetical protein